MMHDRDQPLQAPTVVTIGDGTRREFVEPMRWLEARCQLCSWPSTEQCLHYLRSAPAGPALIVWLQSYLGQFSETDLAKYVPSSRVPRWSAFMER